MTFKMNIEIQKGKTFERPMFYGYLDNNDLDECGCPKKKMHDITGSVMVFRVWWQNMTGGPIELFSSDPTSGFVNEVGETEEGTPYNMKLTLPLNFADPIPDRVKVRFEIDRQIAGRIEEVIYGEIQVTDWIPQ